MTFQPLGYRFELISTMPKAEAKIRLRERRVGWFAAKEGPRGWLVGSVFCLWLSAFDRYGPMVFGVITEHERGTRVRGFAGSDLNGVLLFTLLIPLMAFLIFQVISDGSATPRQFLVFGVVFLIGGTFVYWSAHKDRRQAEPLIDFIEVALGKVRTSRRRRSQGDSGPLRQMRLTSNGEPENGIHATADKVCEAIDAMRYDRYGSPVLALSERYYMQSAASDGGFVLEKREGNATAHFAAKRLDGSGAIFSAEEITEAFLGYLEGQIETPGVRWEQMDL